MSNICYLTNDSYSMYDGIHAIIEEYFQCNYDMELNLDTADEITSFVDEYIRYRLDDFMKSIKYKTLEERLYAAVSEEFDVPYEIFEADCSGTCSDREDFARNVADYIRYRYLQELSYYPRFEAIEKLIDRDGEFAMHISRIKASIGIV